MLSLFRYYSEGKRVMKDGKPKVDGVLKWVNFLFFIIII